MASSLTLSMKLRRDAERLFDLSLWCLGRDVKHPEGNLLLRHGLTRERPPQEQQGNSEYMASLPGGGTLKLWGFGVLCDDCNGAVYIARAGFSPRLVDRAGVCWPVFHAEALHGAREPGTFQEQLACRAAVVTVAEWLARYEEWVGEQVGPAWRRACLAEHRKAPPVSAEELAAAWWRVSARTHVPEFVVNDLTALVAGA